MRRVLYFHGFASSPASAKITALRPLLDPHGIELDTPDLNVPSFEKLDWNAIVARAVEAARANPPHAIAGSSLGALVALSVIRHDIDVPLVLIAPALGIAGRWRTKVPAGDPIMAFHHALGREAPIHRAFFDQMAHVSVDADPPPVRTVAIIGRNDESVPFECVAETWQRWTERGLASGSKLIPIDGGDHGLTAFVDVIAREIIEAAEAE